MGSRYNLRSRDNRIRVRERAEPAAVPATANDESISVLGRFTETKVEQIRFNWTIDGFLSQSKVLNSEIFSTGGNDGAKWCIQLNPKGSDEETKDNYVGIYLKLVSSKDNERVTANCLFAIVNANGKETRINPKTRSIYHTFVPGECWGFHQFFNLKIFDQQGGVKRILSKGKLTVIAEVSVGKIIRPLEEEFNVPSSKLKLDMSRLFESGEFADVTLVCETTGDEIPAHKVVLAARSTLFSTYLSKDQEGEMTDRLIIPDMEAAVLKEMLKFMYTGTINLSEDDNDVTSTIALLYAGNDFELEGLKVICENSLASRLSSENAVEILFAAQANSREKLKAQAVQFIKSHAPDVMKSEGWQAMIRANPLAAICESLVPEDEDEPPAKRRRTVPGLGLFNLFR